MVFSFYFKIATTLILLFILLINTNTDLLQTNNRAISLGSIKFILFVYVIQTLVGTVVYCLQIYLAQNEGIKDMTRVFFVDNIENTVFFVFNVLYYIHIYKRIKSLNHHQPVKVNNNEQLQDNSFIFQFQEQPRIDASRFLSEPKLDQSSRLLCKKFENELMTRSTLENSRHYSIMSEGSNVRNKKGKIGPL